MYCCRFPLGHLEICQYSAGLSAGFIDRHAIAICFGTPKGKETKCIGDRPQSTLRSQVGAKFRLDSITLGRDARFSTSRQSSGGSHTRVLRRERYTKLSYLYGSGRASCMLIFLFARPRNRQQNSARPDRPGRTPYAFCSHRARGGEENVCCGGPRVAVGGFRAAARALGGAWKRRIVLKQDLITPESRPTPRPNPTPRIKSTQKNTNRPHEHRNFILSLSVEITVEYQYPNRDLKTRIGANMVLGLFLPNRTRLRHLR